MSGGSLQALAAKGVQDAHLSIAPETSFWKRTYKRVSNYAIESIDQQISSVGWDKEYVVQMSRNGDLVADTWLNLELNLLALQTPGSTPDTVYWTNALGHAMIKHAALEIGTNEIDSTNGLHMEIKWELESDVNRDTNELVLRSTTPQQLLDWSTLGNTLDKEGNPIVQLWVKLPFYYTKARSQALPLIALQYHDVRFKFTLRPKSDLLIFSNSSNTTLSSVNNGEIRNGAIVCDFVFLDQMERRLFAANSHEYLIKNLQVSNFHTKASGATRLNANVVFNHPVTCFYWVVQKQSHIDAKDWFNFERTDGQGDDTITSATIKFNGAERERPRGPLFWRTIKSARHFNRTPRKNIYLYSSAEAPSAWYPTGSVNLSRIDNTSLEFTFPTTDANGSAFGEAVVSVLSENFNVVRLQGNRFTTKVEGMKTFQDKWRITAQVEQSMARLHVPRSGEPLKSKFRCPLETVVTRTLVTPVPFTDFGMIAAGAA